jgi:hypothetical protein
MGLLAGAAALALGANALAVVNLTAGSATYSFTQPPNGTGTGGSANMSVGDGNTADHVFQDQWWWRVNGVSARETTLFGGAEAGGGTANGTVTYNNVGGLGFNVVQNLALTDTGTAQASLVNSLVITNTSGAALDMSFFSYLDFDIGGSAGTDVGIWQDQANNIMRVTDGANFGEYQGLGANAFQVTAFATLRGLLADADIDNLNNTGLPFASGDFTGGFQWNVNIAAGGSLTLTTIRTINTAIPAPGALALLGLAGLVGGRRRRA